MDIEQRLTQAVIITNPQSRLVDSFQPACNPVCAVRAHLTTLISATAMARVKMNMSGKRHMSALPCLGPATLVGGPK